MGALLQFSKKTNAPHTVQSVVIIHNYCELMEGQNTWQSHRQQTEPQNDTVSGRVCTPVQVFIIFQGQHSKACSTGPYGDLICGIFYADCSGGGAR